MNIELFSILIFPPLSRHKCDIQCSKENLNTAIKVHNMHLKDPSTVTEESQFELLKFMEKAKKCLEVCK